MRVNLSLLSICVIVWQPTLCFYDLCRDSKNTLLTTEECSDLYFESSEKATALGRVKLELQENSLRLTPTASAWTTTFLKISTPHNVSNQLCSKLSNEGSSSSYCFTLSPEMINETFLIEYKIEKLPEISSRKFLFSLPEWNQAPLFLYTDQTDASRLVINAQKLPNILNVSSYKVEAYKEKNGNTNLQDLRIFSSKDEIQYDIFTYNDVGNYYFVVWVMSDNCTDRVCLKMTTPSVFIERKGTRVVIGIVGASFILPFILFIFHILTKRYPEDNSSKTEDLVVAYKSSSKKHNDVVAAFAGLLEKLTKNVVIEVVDLSKSARKFPQKFCVDSLNSAQRVIYVAPPKNDPNPILVDKSLSEKEFFAVIFEHCTGELPQFIENANVFRFFEDFERFLQALNISSSYDIPVYHDLVNKTEEAKNETDQADGLPRIIVTDSEPQEYDSLISAKVVL